MLMRTARILLFLAGVLTTLLPRPAAAKECRVSGVATYTGNVNDVLATPDAYWVASDGGVQEFDRATRKLLRTYTHLDGLSTLSASRLNQTPQGDIVATLAGATCTLRGSRFTCRPQTKVEKERPLQFRYHGGARVRVEKLLPEGALVGTAGGHAFLGAERLGTPLLPDRHITALSLFRGKLWLGTFNGGLAREHGDNQFRPVSSPGMLINALQAGREHLFVGTSDGLFQTKDGVTFEQVDFVEQAVVGLAFDGTSIWATTPGALYRIKDGRGPRSDVWWLPGGSRSLQKVSAVPGYVWFGTEDRGAIVMQVGPKTTARDKPFTVYDRGQGLPSSWSLAVAATPGGDAWMTTLREGLTFIARHGESRSVATGVSAWGLSALATPDGAWIGSQNGAAFVEKSGKSARAIQGLPDPRVHAFLADSRKESAGRLFIGTENGLAWCDVK